MAGPLSVPSGFDLELAEVRMNGFGGRTKNLYEFKYIHCMEPHIDFVPISHKH